MNLRCSLCFFCMLMFACSPQQNSTDTTEETIGQAEDRQVENDNRKIILFFGNSLTAGYGLELEEAFPSLIQYRIDSLGLDYRVVNAGVSGETTADGNSRISWILDQYSPIEVFVLELGANDGLRGLNLNQTRENLQAIIDQVKTPKS